MFKDIKVKVEQQFQVLAQHQLFVVELNRDALVDAYLSCFSDLDIRQEHNCNCCKSFLRQYGGIVAIVNNEVQTIWDFELEGLYQDVPKTLAKLVREAAIRDVFVSKERVLGTDFNIQIKPDFTKRWEHFSVVLPQAKVFTGCTSVESRQGDVRSSKQVFKRALDEITIEAVETVLELISQDSIYRGQEFKQTLTKFHNAKQDYSILTEQQKELFAWLNCHCSEARIRNSSIGTLLVDLSEGRDLEQAVKAFENMVAPANYKRPTAIVTKAQLERAEQDLKDLGLDQSIYRRYAVPEDITVDNLLFVDRTPVKNDLFSGLKDDVVVNPRLFSRVEEVPVDKFISDVVPTATSLEVLLENKHTSNFMSLFAPEHRDAPTLFKWNNGISWAYVDGLTDSVKERVKAAGGSVEGELRVSLEWFNYDDLDLSVEEPNGNRIWFRSKTSPYSGGFLDVDMNAGSGQSREAVENIIFKDKNRMIDGVYKVYVHNYAKRENNYLGFNVEIECRGSVLQLGQSTAVNDDQRILVATINYTKKDGIIMVENGISESTNVQSKEVWGIDTNKFHKVTMILNSPNFWNGQEIGNKHTFFILDKARNTSRPRGIFNEFLKQDLLQHHKRVFELLGNRMVVADCDRQLSGLGFSTTQRNEVFVRVTGRTTRVIKVKF
ncbi:MAG: hypothetical protein WC967_13560 [Balneolaceae bacterium]